MQIFRYLILKNYQKNKRGDKILHAALQKTFRNVLILRFIPNTKTSFDVFLNPISI